MNIINATKKMLSYFMFSVIVVIAFLIFHKAVIYADKYTSYSFHYKLIQSAGMSIFIIGLLIFLVSLMGFFKVKMWPFSAVGFAIVLIGIVVFNSTQTNNADLYHFSLYLLYILPVVITYFLFNLNKKIIYAITIFILAGFSFVAIVLDFFKTLNISSTILLFYIINFGCITVNSLYLFKEMNSKIKKPIIIGYVAYATFFVLSGINYLLNISFFNSNELIYGNLVILLDVLVLYIIRAIEFNVSVFERKKMNKINSIWIERIGNISETVCKQDNFDSFCIATADGLKSLIQMDRHDTSNLFTNNNGENIAKIVIVNKNGELKIVDKSNNLENISIIDSNIKRNADKTLIFGSTFVDIYFFTNDMLKTFIHLEGFKYGFSENIKNILKIAHSYISIALYNLELKINIKETQESLIYSLSDISDAKSENQGDHIKHIAEFVRIICKGLNMSAEEIEVVTQASMMHDIGKLAIADEIVGKEGKLTKEQFEIMKLHTAFGYNMLSKAKGEILKAAALIAGQHHEKWDGSGYLGLKGEQIHLYSRIVAVADVFDALLSERSYKKAWTLQQVYNYMNEYSGSQFDPGIIKVFNQYYKELYSTYMKNTEKTTA